LEEKKIGTTAKKGGGGGPTMQGKKAERVVGNGSEEYRQSKHGMRKLARKKKKK